MSRNTIEIDERETHGYAAPRAPRRMTFDEYLHWDAGTTMTEWVDGEVIVMSPVAKKHQDIVSFLNIVINLFVTANDLGSLFLASYVMRLRDKRRGREPDLFFVVKERAGLIKKNYLDGAADLAIEIISPESVARDREEKFAEYEAAGVREYWIIDPEHEQAEFYSLENGHYRLQSVSEGVYRSTVLRGFHLQVAWLWQEPLPTFAALRELKIVP